MKNLMATKDLSTVNHIEPKGQNRNSKTGLAFSFLFSFILDKLVNFFLCTKRTLTFFKDFLIKYINVL